VDVTFTRVYGVFSGGEDCRIANIPFAYASLVEGVFRFRGVEHRFDHSPRYRAYVESTWGCEFPRPGRESDDPAEFPWKWMWAVAPALPRTAVDGAAAATDVSALPPLPPAQAAFASQAARVGTERGEVGVVVANARMYHDALGVITGTFAYIDTPTLHIAAANVSLWDDTTHRFPLLLASSADADALVSLTMEHGGFEGVEDALGPAALPMWQVLTVLTRRFRVRVAYTSRRKI
jgi:hypothetical protein